MKKILIGCLCLVFSLYSCQESEKEVPASNMLQIASFDYFASGQYDGVYPLGELLQKADFGIGTVDGLDGEMIVKDGKAYQVPYTGQVTFINATVMLPFAMMCDFKPDTVFTYTDKTPLYKKIDELIHDSTKLLAIEIQGRYSSLTTRSVRKQVKPYKKITDVLATDQVVFYPHNLNGVALGYRIPERCISINPAGYHIHYISNDEKEGGHVLDFMTDSVTVSIQVLDNIELVWPK